MPTSHWFAVATDATLGYPLLFTVKVAVITLGLHAVIGPSLGYYLGRRSSPARSAVDALVTLPLVFPPVALGFILLLLLGKKGPIGSVLVNAFGVEIIFSLWGVVIAAFIAGLPLIVKPVQAAVQSTARDLIEASYMLGKTESQTFIHVVIPSIRRTIAGGLSLAFGRSLGEVGLTLMLGGNVVGKTNTLSLEIYNSVFTGEFDRAIVLASVLGVASLMIFMLLKRLSAV
jgi:molybdate transport system permease protein